MLTAANKTELADAIEKRNPYSFLNTNAANQGMTLPTHWCTSSRHVVQDFSWERRALARLPKPRWSVALPG